jgi:putative phosphoesterase
LPRGSRQLPEECLRLLAASDLILHAGDVAETPVLEQLAELAPVVAVHGNMDEPALQASLPERRVVEVGEARIGMVHDGGPAAGRLQRLAGWFPGCAAVVYGHSHQPEVTRHGPTWILNPGSPTERRRAPQHTMIVLEARQKGLIPRLVELS